MSKALEICDRVYAVGGSGLSGPEDACVYLVDASSELVLIDSGAGLSIDRIEKNIRSAGFEPAQIWHIIATHCHIDHIGGLKPLVQRYGSKVIAHELDRSGIEGENNDLTAANMYGIDYQPVKVDILIKGEAEKLRLGDVEFNFVHTQATLQERLSLHRYQRRKGPVRQDIHGPFSPAWGSDLTQWRRSMGKLLALKADVLCEGHAGVYKGDRVRKYMEEYLRRYQA